MLRVACLRRLCVWVGACLVLVSGGVARGQEVTLGDDVAWSMVVMPDTQYYTLREERMVIFNYTTQWIADNKDAMKIGLMLNEGDIVQTAGSDAQWQLAKGAISRLDGHVPYVLATGNHDHGRANAENRDTKLNAYFSATDNALNDPAKGGILAGTMEPGRLENAYYDFTAPDGRKILITALEWGPRDAVVEWADAVAGRPEFAGHTAVLTTHAFLYYDDTRYDFAAKGNAQSWNPYRYSTANDPAGTNDGEELWQKLVKKNGNHEMVFSGHVLNDQVGRRTDLNDAAKAVHQMLFNAQNDPNGGDGWIRILEFLEDGETVRVRTVSPWLASQGEVSERLVDDHHFSLKLSKVPEPGAAVMLVGVVLGARRRRRLAG